VTKAVFTQKAESIYDDLPEQRYHFPRTYLRQVESSLGDWIVYYRPRRGASSTGRQPASTYFAVARLVEVMPDPNASDLFYTRVDGYVEFDGPVSFRREEGSYETSLLKADGSVSKGSFGRSVRGLTDDAFDAIVSAGFSDRLPIWESVDEAITDTSRPWVERISRRPYRDARFRRQVREAYDNTCAFTGLHLVNGGGRPEVQAAHIRPVERDGPDSVRNGIALSGTAHWMFDRGLITLDKELRVVVSHKVDIASLGGLIMPDRSARLPTSRERRPSEIFLSYHREHVFHE